MTTRRKVARRLAALALSLLAPFSAQAGPPYITDDPEPVEYKHWEIYMASQLSHDLVGWSGTLPHMEVNYGAAPNLQLHMIAPLSFTHPAGGVFRYGNGNTELGAKYRFIQETSWMPQVGTFPLVEVPTGDKAQGLGSLYTPVLLPLWLQKSVGKWTTYGGGGYWFNPGIGNRNWGIMGWQAQCNLNEHFSSGAEIVYMTPQTDDGEARVAFNLGAIINFTENHHLLLSAGRDFHGISLTQAYIAYQLTFGPSQKKT